MCCSVFSSLSLSLYLSHSHTLCLPLSTPEDTKYWKYTVWGLLNQWFWVYEHGSFDCNHISITITITAMDSRIVQHYIHRVGICIYRSKDDKAVVILRCRMIQLVANCPLHTTLPLSLTLSLSLSHTHTHINTDSDTYKEQWILYEFCFWFGTS